MYEPMSKEQAGEVIARYTSGEYVSMGPDHTAELAEAYMVLNERPLEQIHAMREGILGASAND